MVNAKDNVENSVVYFEHTCQTTCADKMEAIVRELQR